jgi:drug/metabolite transporter (DMT)-like permease
MGILLGLTAAIFWGIGDFLARFITQDIGTYRTLFFIQFIGILGLGIYLLSTGELQHTLMSTSWQPWVWALLSILLNIISSLSLYRAFEVGTLTIVSPIASSYAAVTIILSLLSGESLTLTHDLGIVLVLIGIIVVTTPVLTLSSRQTARVKAVSLQGSDVPSASGKLVTLPIEPITPFWRNPAIQGIFFALGAALCYGTTFWILGYHVSPSLGGLIPVWLIRLGTPCVLLLASPLTRQSLQLPRGSIWWYIVGVGLFDTVGYIAYTTGQLQGHISIVTILSSLYSAVTVLLAAMVLREQLQRSQWFGIVVIFMGIALVNL